MPTKKLVGLYLYFGLNNKLLVIVGHEKVLGNYNSKSNI